MQEGRFRSDIYYRLNIINITIPPLRQRKEDIIILADYFISQRCKALGKNPKRLSDDAVMKMMEYPWPGNVRELENVIERGVSFSAGDTIEARDLFAGNGYGKHLAQPATARAKEVLVEDAFGPVYEEPAADRQDRQHSAAQNRYALQVIGLLEKYNGSVKDVANALGIPQSTLYRKLKQYQINPKEYRF